MLALYGALLSTVLAAISILKFTREWPRISVEAKIVSSAADEGADTHGVLVRVQRGDSLLWEEKNVEVRIRNAGNQAIQITDVLVETADAVLQIRPKGLPVMLEPNAQHSVRVQPECLVPKTPCGKGLHDVPVVSVGVLDALARKHRVREENLEALITYCRALPVRTGAYRHRETGSIIAAFQAKDSITIVSKKAGPAQEICSANAEAGRVQQWKSPDAADT